MKGTFSIRKEIEVDYRDFISSLLVLGKDWVCGYGFIIDYYMKSYNKAKDVCSEGSSYEDILTQMVLDGGVIDFIDEEELHYSKLDEHTYSVEGKTPLVDFYKITDIDGEVFEEHRGDSSTLAGFMLEHAGRILERGDAVEFKGYTLFVEAADKRKIKRVKVTLPH